MRGSTRLVEMSERTVKDLLGGGLKPSDPRRYLIESMLCAISADGVIDARETAVLERQISQHPLFEGINPAAARTLIELSDDAIKFAGSAIGRAPAIAKGLPARIHRLAAYAMAAEVAAADERFERGELSFLEALRIALRISPGESGLMVEAARSGETSAHLDDRYLKIKNLIPIAAEIFALRALARGVANDEHRFKVRDLFVAIPDLSLSTDELDAELYRAFRRPRSPGAEVFGELSNLARGLPDPVDRYWMMVYALVAEPPANVPSWRVIPFIGVMQAAMHITDTDMELASVDALTFPASVPRPS